MTTAYSRGGGSPASPEHCPSRGPPVLPGSPRFHRARERARTTLRTSRDPIPTATAVTAEFLRPSGDWARPSTFLFFTR
ncbi:hypothetical protein NDU88_002829 [Pleurodeles waltl]|uniref:Uncharacterized protein n=1 Tax=Pleurodeles waltl TaxID=8319 RepID=A0AAV7SC34_PLEWA|nr:hypothetical protein NDU88_002829 [Pleurodeles waltl]